MRRGTGSFYKRGMRILGIDPGYGRLGVAIIDAEKGKKEILVHSECFETSAKMPHAERLNSVKEKIKKTIDEFSPGAVGIESLLFSKNKKTAFGVAEARGVILSEIAGCKIPITEFGPGQIKIAVTGHGGSDKNHVRKMIEIILGKSFDSAKDDECDAVAVAIALAAIGRF